MEQTKVPNSEHYGIRNPFRVPMLHKQFDAMVYAYFTKHKDLVRKDGVRPGNAWAMHFYRGYDGIPRPLLDNMKDTPAYACWRAGKAVRKRSEAK